jgi:endonuclease G
MTHTIEMTDTFKLDLETVPLLRDMTRLGGAVPGAAFAESVAVLERGPRVSPPEDLADRTGYDKSFLTGFPVPVPKPTSERADDLLRLEEGGTLLHYLHFSLAMSRSRKIAMFTAVNIDGSRAVVIKRTPDKWSYDGRVPLDAQLGEELYQDNLLDRGHLVRREDPNWGSEKDANIANGDTFHFTNCSPQMHAMNAVTWVGLENYVLKNARVWKDRVTVFTGPVFSDNDLTYRGVGIPLAFWKVLAFLSDSGRPSATAYMVDQENELSSLEAAFGRYKTYQRSIRYVEQISGLDFGRLKTYDGFSNEEIQNGTPRGRQRVETVIESPEDIRV